MEELSCEARLPCQFLAETHADASAFLLQISTNKSHCSIAWFIDCARSWLGETECSATKQFNRIVNKLLLKLLDLCQIMRRIANEHFELTE